VDRSTRKDRLRELRQQGLVPLSRVATRLFILSAVSGAIYLLAERTVNGLISSLGSWPSVTDNPAQILTPAVMFAGILSVTVLVVGVISSVAQIGAVTRVGTVFGLRRGAKLARLSPSVLLVLFIATVISLAAAKYVTPLFMPILHLEPEAVGVGILSNLITQISKLVVVAAAVLAILVVFGYRFGFFVKANRRLQK
jgi:hypothetical protein